jgi:hypothetical protein
MALDLSYNEIGDKGIQYLAYALRDNKVTMISTCFPYVYRFIFTDVDYI